MGYKVVAWLEDEDRSGTATNIAAVADNPQGTTTSGDNLRLPPNYRFVYAAIPWTESSSYPIQRVTLSQARISQNPLIMNKGIAGAFLNDGQIYDFRAAPFVLNTGENTTVTGVEDDQAGVAHYLGLVLFLTNTPTRVPVRGLPRITHPLTCTIGQMTAGSWTNSALTEVNTLPEGVYNCWGGRVHTATGVAFRLVFNNYDDRPPLLPVANEENPTPSVNYWGRPYTFRIPDGLPSVDGLCAATETPSDIELYLQKVR